MEGESFCTSRPLCCSSECVPLPPAGAALLDQTRTRRNKPPSRATHDKLRALLRDDYEFYFAAKQRFHYILRRLRESQLYTEDVWDSDSFL